MLDMRRRQFITLLSGTAAWPLVASAQAPTVPVVGFLHSGSPDPGSSYWPALAAFRNGLGEFGFVEGRNLSIEYRWAEDQFARLPTLAGELVARAVALIFVGGGDVAVLAAKQATTTIPIVFAIGADPVRQGLVASLGRPGGNITGATFLSVELRPKMLELMRELLPKAVSIGVLGNPNRPGYDQLVDEVLKPAQAMGLRVHVLTASNEREIDTAFATLARAPADALIMLSDPVYGNRRNQIAELARSYKVPTIYYSREFVVAGGLVSYGASIQDAYHHAGIYCGRILKGEKPADLPVFQPTRFELVINLKTAKALGLEVPPTLLARADEVIE
jgi:putative tryptophan/tyrosine transport system substrate-binding protein